MANEAFKSYKKTSPRQRRTWIRCWSNAIKASRNDLAAICTLELGKPISESLQTIDYAVSFLDWFETQIEQVAGTTFPATLDDSRIFTMRQPQGVVAVITPWSSPVAMVTRKVGAALAAGNTVVLKPAPQTPLCAIALAKLCQRAGFPAGVLNVVTASFGSTPDVGVEMCQSPLVRHLSFTGSTAVGRFLNTECARTSSKRVSLELGGNAPFIIFADADLDRAVDGLMASKFRSSGQTCVSANRILVHSDVFEDVAARLEKRIRQVGVAGDVWDPKTNYGPLHSANAVKKVRTHILDAEFNGCVRVIGGLGFSDSCKRWGPNFVPPTVLLQTSSKPLSELPALSLETEETFGPLAVLTPFQTEEEVIAYANKSQAGLASYFYTEDISRVWRVAEALDTGMVGVRVGLVRAAEQPFCGIKQSGGGREGGTTCLEEYTEVKSITLGL
jgi:succinate-semialdehyde dehydrogenase/glutarate-semialdehyde dehydrogenase